MEENKKEIALQDITKSVSVQELESIITVLKDRQKYFEEAYEHRRKFEKKTIDKLKETQELPEEAAANIMLLANTFANEMDQKFFDDHKEELEAQEGVNEFLFRFTGEKQVNYKYLFSNNSDLTTI